ncbi:metal cation symporter ZIP8 [Takifugu flavidus]|uniref:Zinc transporter ZIP8 n=1 Tax=Takifugu flavidus TaxID=433684 RepID=A0A5C6NYC1_9TELE|nr:metal cation symporter ZIP8 [Takifugu flavidus]TWW72522.1 Zinc transporter ZIP8 [Takifugu flavidus]
MVQFNSLVWCLLVFLPQSRGTTIEEHDGEEVLESVVHFHAGAQSIPAQNLSELLPIIANRSAAGELELPQCPSTGKILSYFGFSDVGQLTVEHLERICSAMLTQVLLPSCPYAIPTSPPPLHHGVWGYGFLAVTLINLASLLGLFLIPFTKKPYFPKVLTYFIGLAIGTLFSNAVLQLIPEALGFDPDTDSYVSNATGICGGFYILFFVEKLLKMALKVEHQHGHFSPVDTNQDPSVHNGDVMEKKDGIILTTINTIAVDRSNPGPDLPGPVSTTQVSGGVMCHWLRGTPMSGIKTVAWMVTLSDALHNFIDGLAIGAAFTVSIMTGFSTSIAIVCEEFPHELGDFVILLNAGMSVPQAVFFNLLSAMSCYIGLVLGIMIGSTFAPGVIFAIAGGMFLYIALADMFPEMDSITQDPAHASSKMVFFLIQNLGMLSGFTIILMITVFGGQISLG